MHYFAIADKSALPSSTPKITKALKKKMVVWAREKAKVAHEKIVDTPWPAIQYLKREQTF